MGVLLTICPVTAGEIETGIETDKSTLARAGNFVGRVRCPLCRGEHVLSKANVWVCERIGGTESLSPTA